MTLQQFAAIAAVVAVPAIVAGALYVVYADPRLPEETAATLARVRRRGFFILMPILFAAIFGFSLWTPYKMHDAHVANAAVDADDTYIVHVTGRQWEWELTDKDGKPLPRSPQGMSIIPVGKVMFVVTSEDVTHGFTIEDPSKSFLEGQVVRTVQAVPGHEHAIVVTLEPGEYDIPCSTYCDGAHDQMKDTFIVVAHTEGETK